MANGKTDSAGLSFSSETFAKLTPARFLHAHLQQANAIRPNGRSPTQFRIPAINTGSLTHSSGSAVVRVGDTAVVCGIRAEVLLASDITSTPSGNVNEHDLVEELGLLVPNVELSTGCSPANLPGNPPSTLAQALSYRILSLLHTAHLFSPADLSITYADLGTGDDGDYDEGVEGPGRIVTKGYWVLYIDVLCMSLDGNAFDATWAAVVAALRDTMLPQAWWDADREMVLCSPRLADATRLSLRVLPIAATFALFSTASPLKNSDAAESWILADPDALEEEVGAATFTAVAARMPDESLTLLSVEKTGGGVTGGQSVMECVSLAYTRLVEWEAVLQGA